MQLDKKKVFVFNAPAKAIKELGTALTQMGNSDELEIEFKNGVLKFIVSK